MNNKTDLSIAVDRDAHAGIEKKRSSHWPVVERAHLKEQPVCVACGSSEKLNVHHMKPFHLFPELELEPTNLITLCMSDNHCHILLGHGDNFKAYNPNVKEDVDKVHSNIKLLTETAEEAKKNRLF